jgi:hypothetical protein
MKKGILYSLIAGIAVIIGVIIIYLLGAFFSGSSTGENIFSTFYKSVSKPSGQKMAVNQKQKIVEKKSPAQTKIFLTVLAGSDLFTETEGELIGCNDKLLPIVIGENLTPQETLNKLLTYTPTKEGLYNALGNESLEGVLKKEEGVVKVYLTGEGLGGGVCDAPRITEEIRMTMTQFPEIKNVEIFFNGSPVERYLSEADRDFILPPPPGDKIYFGAFPDFGGPEDNVTAERIEKFNKLVGKPIKWAYFSNNWGKDGVKFPKEKAEVIAGTGTIPFVRMMPRRLFDTAYDKTFSLQKIIDGNFDDDLHQYAKDVKEYGEMVLMDFGVEMNGDWFPWSGVVNGGAVKAKYGDPNKADGPERFVDAYRHIIDIFREENVENVTWFFHPDFYSYPDANWNMAKKYYPGDDYIDWVGVSAYGPQHPAEDYWDTFPTIMRGVQPWILEVAKKKPLALLEFGVTDHHPLGKKSSWLAGAFEYILNKDSLIQFKAISPWHENWEEEDNLWATLRLDSSAGALATFKKFIADERFVGSSYETTN